MLIFNFQIFQFVHLSLLYYLLDKSMVRAQNIITNKIKKNFLKFLWIFFLKNLCLFCSKFAIQKTGVTKSIKWYKDNDFKMIYNKENSHSFIHPSIHSFIPIIFQLTFQIVGGGWFYGIFSIIELFLSFLKGGG